MIDELLIEYADKFDDNFPIFCVLGFDEDEIIRVIQRCLDDGIPYIVDYSDKNVVY